MEHHVRAFLRQLRRCPACDRIIRPGQKVVRINGKAHHRACARYQAKGVKSNGT